MKALSPLISIIVLGLMLVAIAGVACAAEKATPTPTRAPVATATPTATARPGTTPTPTQAVVATPTPTSSPMPTAVAKPMVLRASSYHFGKDDPVDDPHSWHQNGMQWDRVFRWDQNANTINQLAAKWEVVDGTNWRFHLRKDLTWWDGSPVNAHDVKFSVDEIVKRPGASARSFSVLGFKEIAVVDDYTVDLKFAALNVTGWWVMSNVWILPKAYIERVGWEKFRQQPMGSGPWKWTEWVVWDHTYAEKVNRPHPFRSVQLDRIEFRMVTEVDTAISALRTGALDLIQIYMPPESVKSLENLGHGVLTGGANRARLLLLPMDACRVGYPTCDKRVRQALNLAIDREAIAKNTFLGFAEPISQPGFPMRAGYDPSIPVQYDPKKAESLLDEAGFPRKADGYRFTIPLMTWSTGTIADTMLAAIDMWDKVGVKVKYEKVEFSVALDYLLRREGKQPYPMFQLDNQGTQPENALFTSYCYDPAVPPKLCSTPYDNAEFYKLKESYMVEPDPAKRAELLQRAHRIVVDDPPEVWLTTNPLFAVYHPKVKGAEFDSFLKLFWDNVYIDPKATLKK